MVLKNYRPQLAGIGSFFLILFIVTLLSDDGGGYFPHPRRDSTDEVMNDIQNNTIQGGSQLKSSQTLSPEGGITLLLPKLQLSERQLWEVSVVEKQTKQNRSSDSDTASDLQRCYTLYDGGCISKATGSKQKSYTPYIKPTHGTDTLSITVLHKETIVKSAICNEGEAKRVPLVGKRDFIIPEEDKMSNKVLIVTLCWDTYGYHLWNCVLGSHAVARMHNVSKKDTYVAVLKSSWASHKFSTSEWSDSSQQFLWSIVAEDHSRVKSLRDWISTCFNKIIVGHVPLFDITPSQNLAARNHLLSNLNIQNPYSDANRRACSNRWQSVIIERKSNFHIKNLIEVKGWLSEVSQNVTIALLEDLPFKEQVRLVSSSDIVIGTHGNGLTWVTLMYQGVLIEIWGQYPYNSNYEGSARRGNNRYLPISLHQSGCYKRCDVFLPQNVLLPILSLAVSHLHNVSCKRQWYDPNTLSHMFDEIQIEKGLKKRKRNKGMGSPPYLETSNL